jgi:hypothetical protein
VVGRRRVGVGVGAGRVRVERGSVRRRALCWCLLREGVAFVVLLLWGVSVSGWRVLRAVW